MRHTSARSLVFALVRAAVFNAAPDRPLSRTRIDDGRLHDEKQCSFANACPARGVGKLNRQLLLKTHWVVSFTLPLLVGLSTNARADSDVGPWSVSIGPAYVDFHDSTRLSIDGAPVALEPFEIHEHTATANSK